MDSEDYKQCLSSLNSYNAKSVDGKFLVNKISDLMDSFKFCLDKMMENFQENIVKLCQERDTRIAAIEAENKTLETKIEKLETKIDDTEAYERRDTVVISGNAVPPVEKMENCAKLARQLIKEKVGFVVSENDISVAHRLGDRSRKQGTDRRDIILKFCRRDTKIGVISASRTAKPSDFFINESLTPMRQTIAYVLRKAKREFPNIVSGSATLHGKN